MTGVAGSATFRGRNLVITEFPGAALEPRGNAAVWLATGGSNLGSAILHGNGDGGEQLGVDIEPHVEYVEADPRLPDVRYGLNPDLRPRIGSPARLGAGGAGIPTAGEATTVEVYSGAFDEENWLDEWPAFGPDPNSPAPLAGGADGHR